MIGQSIFTDTIEIINRNRNRFRLVTDTTVTDQIMVGR